MSPKLRAKCPHCQAILTVDRPDEPRMAPCPGCGGEIRIPSDIIPASGPSRPLSPSRPAPVPQQSFTQVNSAATLGGRRLPFVVGGVIVAVVLVAFVIKGHGTEVAQVMQGAQQIDRQRTAAKREADMDELRAKKSRMESEIRNLETRLLSADAAIGQLLSQPNINTTEIQSALEGVRR